jgi:hypothetical protein
LAFTRNAPFKLVKQDRHPLLKIEVLTQHVKGVCLSQLLTTAEYTMHVVLPNQDAPWFAHICLWYGARVVVTANDPGKHLNAVMANLRKDMVELIGEWKYDNR